MSWKVIRPQIETLLNSLSYIQEVSRGPKLNFNGYPAAHIIPSENSGDYETTSENVRTYAWTVRLFNDTKQTSIEDSLTALEEVVDAVLDAFDQEDLKGSDTRTVGLNLPSGYTYLNIWASPGVWGELPEDQLVMAEVHVRVRISRDIS